MLYSLFFPRVGITSASGCRPHHGDVFVHCPIAINKKGEEVPEIPTSLQLHDERRQAEERGPRSPHPLTHITHKGRDMLLEPPKGMRGHEDRRERGFWGPGFARSSFISYKRKAGFMDRNGAAACGVWEGAGSCLRRCSHRQGPDPACSVLTQPLPAEGMWQHQLGMERCSRSSCTDGVRNWELDLQPGSFKK